MCSLVEHLRSVTTPYRIPMAGILGGVWKLLIKSQVSIMYVGVIYMQNYRPVLHLYYIQIPLYVFLTHMIIIIAVGRP